ncbi:Hypothetical predicted protein [Paramuricea clavata]|uniref:Uncharacterized protein n=1 Tax=Paramuricea clavata TaxID=317549 RepID=A0A7D9JQT9_PARCT|nr:Hypothetical predicted protein [Paramuricea clavata]
MQVENAAANAEQLYAKMQVQNPGPYCDELKALDRRLNLALNGREACGAFQTLKSKMKADYRRKKNMSAKREDENLQENAAECVSTQLYTARNNT